jgi:hypothetical protein
VSTRQAGSQEPWAIPRDVRDHSPTHTSASGEHIERRLAGLASVDRSAGAWGSGRRSSYLATLSFQLSARRASQRHTVPLRVLTV